MARPSRSGSWEEYAQLVLSELKRLNVGLEAVDGRLNTAILSIESKIATLVSEEIGDMKRKIAVVEIKSGVWGLIAGAVPGLVGAILYWLFHKGP